MKKTFLYTAVAMCSCAVGSANVFTEVSASINFAGGAAYYGYNAPAGPASGTGSHSAGGCGAAPTLTCSVLFMGTLDSSGMLQSSYDSATMTGHVADDGLHGPVDGSATGYAIADDPSGSVGIYGTGTHNTVSGFEEGGTGAGQAGVSDNLHFLVAGAAADTVTMISVRYSVDGSLSGGTGAAAADVDAQLRLGSASFDEGAKYGGPSYTPVLDHRLASGWSSFDVTETAPGSFTFDGVYAITGPTADLGISEYLAGSGAAGATSQYSHTGKVSLGLSPGVTFTSDSGVFLTAETSAPEPGSMVLVALGMVSLAMFGRKRHGSVNPVRR